jgi:hypothetical protein
VRRIVEEAAKDLAVGGDNPWQDAENAAMNRWKLARNWSGSRRRNHRLKVSWLGGPFLRARNSRRTGCLAAAKSAISTAP